jgi:2-polyprenyl-6-methoxyphenol hydroxylase-like FAD-dependent oxidoreductase
MSIPDGCPAWGNDLRLNVDRYGIFCWTRLRRTLCNGTASWKARSRRASKCYCVSQGVKRQWPTSRFTPIRPQYVGVSLVEALIPAAQQRVPELWDLLGGAALTALGGERTIGMSTKPDGSVLLYAGLKTDGDDAKQSLEAASGPEQRVAWFHANFKGWSELWEPLFREAESMVWRPLLVCPTDQRWERKPNVTLIGDAAHVMPPYAGEGVNMAMLDALVLSKLLLSEEMPSAAIAAYEAEMFARMRDMTVDTMGNTEMFYAPDAADRVVAMFRNFGGAEADPPPRRLDRSHKLEN